MTKAALMECLLPHSIDLTERHEMLQLQHAQRMHQQVCRPEWSDLSGQVIRCDPQIIISTMSQQMS